MKNSEVVSRKRAADSSKGGVASVEGGDPSDGEEVGDIAGGNAETDQPAMPRGASTTIPAVSAPAAKLSCRKGKKKVGAFGSGTDIPVFDASVPKIPPDPTSDLNPRSGRGKRPAEGAPDSTV